MSDTKHSNTDDLYKRIKLLSNRKKFEIIKATQKERKTITQLSDEIKLAFNKTSDYVAALEKENLVLKVKEGKEVYVKSNVDLDDIDFKIE